MIFDFTDPVGTLGLIFSALILFELIKVLDAEDQMKHLGKRYKVYKGIIGKVGAGLGVVGSGVQKIFNRIFPTNKQLHNRIVKDMDARAIKKKEIYQMEEEDPFEGEGGIEG